MLTIEILDPKRHNRADFDCGVQELNHYLQEVADQDQDRGLAKTYVLVDGTKIRGYYSLATHSVPRESLPQDIKAGNRKKIKYEKIRYTDLPFLLLGRLAIDKELQGQRYGRAILYDALETTKSIAERVGILGMIVDAKDEKTTAFYRKFGFRSIEGNKNRLVLPITSFPKS